MEFIDIIIKEMKMINQIIDKSDHRLAEKNTIFIGNECLCVPLLIILYSFVSLYCVIVLCPQLSSQRRQKFHIKADV